MNTIGKIAPALIIIIGCSSFHPKETAKMEKHHPEETSFQGTLAKRLVNENETVRMQAVAADADHFPDCVV